MNQYKVKKTNNNRDKAIALMLLLMSATLLFVIYRYAYHMGNSEHASHNQRIENLNKKINTLEKENANLVKHNTLLKSADKFDRSETISLKKEVARLEAELVNKSKDLLFYKSLLEPDSEIFGLYIHSSKLQKVSAGNYAYTVVLAQAKQSAPQARGKIQISVAGKDGKKIINGTAVNFKFKYFQRFDGTLNIKDDQQPHTLLVDVKPAMSKLKPVLQSYNWQQLLGE